MISQRLTSFAANSGERVDWRDRGWRRAVRLCYCLARTELLCNTRHGEGGLEGSDGSGCLGAHVGVDLDFGDFRRRQVEAAEVDHLHPRGYRAIIRRAIGSCARVPAALKRQIRRKCAAVMLTADCVLTA